ncbi:MAG: methylmalonyl Co-A mutase-associated GTPase MeaB [Pseudomonadota bacterium]
MTDGLRLSRDLAARVLAGERRALARGITLVESSAARHRAAARALLAELAAAPARETPARRIGLSGTPGVGKSSFIEALGIALVEQGHRVAVLAVDPSSARSGGSILGDKTRMERLSRHPSAFIRPSPAGRELGGVARRTREAIALVEAAGFDVVLVETVGVGQSETAVAAMTDVFCLLLAPGGGDELQGVKRGIMELADIIVINKADGAMAAQAQATRADYQGALGLLRHRPGDPEGFPKALTASAVTGSGIETVWSEICALDDWRGVEGWRGRRRAAQASAWFRETLERALIDRLAADPALAARLARAEAAVAGGALPPDAAAEDLAAAVRLDLAPEPHQEPDPEPHAEPHATPDGEPDGEPGVRAKEAG